jgi:hypothetical protein
VAVSALALCTSSGLAPVQAATTTQWRARLTDAAVRTDLVAASGSSILVFAQTSYRLSTDLGAHWRTVAPALSGSSGADTPDFVRDGVATFRVDGAGVVVDLATGTSRQVDLSEPLSARVGAAARWKRSPTPMRCSATGRRWR